MHLAPFRMGVPRCGLDVVLALRPIRADDKGVFRPKPAIGQLVKMLWLQPALPTVAAAQILGEVVHTERAQIWC